MIITNAIVPPVDNVELVLEDVFRLLAIVCSLLNFKVLAKILSLAVSLVKRTKIDKWK